MQEKYQSSFNPSVFATAAFCILLSLALAACSLSDTKDESGGIVSQMEDEEPSIFNRKSKKVAFEYIDSSKFERQSNYNKTLNKPPVNDEGDVAAEEKLMELPGGVKYVDIEVGKFMEPKRYGTRILAHFTGWKQDGTKFVSTIDKGVPKRFRLGMNQIMKGIEVGIQGMKVGGTRKIVVPPALAVGDRGDGKEAPQGETLIYKITMLSGGL